MKTIRKQTRAGFKTYRVYEKRVVVYVVTLHDKFKGQFETFEEAKVYADHQQALEYKRARVNVREPYKVMITKEWGYK